MSTLEIEISDEMAAKLNAAAERLGVTPEEFLLRIAEEKLAEADENSLALRKPRLLQRIGRSVNDEVDISIEGRTSVVRPADVATREDKIRDATESVFERRASAYKRLAEGAS